MESVGKGVAAFDDEMPGFINLTVFGSVYKKSLKVLFLEKTKCLS